MTFSTCYLAAFVTPALATAGAAAIAAPILIHLLARRRFKRIRWAAMEFLIDAEKRNRRRVRLEELILLALRCLAVSLVGLTLARPFLSAGDWASVWGTRRAERVIVIDDSFSMGYETDEGSPFQSARKAARQLIETFRRETPSDSVSVVRMSAPTSPVVSSVYLDAEEVEATLARVEALSPSQHAGDIDALFKALAELLERDEGLVNAAVYVLSDFQRRDWTPRDGSEGSTANSSLAPLLSWAAKDRNLRVLLVNVGQPTPANMAVTSLKVPGGLPVAGTNSPVRATIANYSAQPAKLMQLSLVAGQRSPVAKSIPTVGEHLEVSVDVEAEFLHAGDERILMEIPPDALPIDNVRFATVEVVNAIRVLIVNGEPSADEYEDEVSLLRTALRPEGEVFSGQEISVVDEAGLEATDLSGFHAVILANVYRVVPKEAESLERFVKAGGGLILFLGDQVDAVAYNADLHRDGAGLLPGKLGETIQPAESSRLVVVDRLHPALRATGGAEDPLGLSEVGFQSYFAFSMDSASPEPAGSIERPESVTDDGSYSGRILARFSDADGHPAIVERGFGRGRVLVITTSADKEWNNWPDHPTYLPIMNELLRHVARPGAQSNEQWVGSGITFPLDPTLYEPDFVVRTPQYPEESEIPASAVAAEDGGGFLVRWERTATTGIYQFVLRRRGGGEFSRLVAVNSDPTESDLTMIDNDVLGRAMAGVPHEIVRGLDELAEAAGEAKTEWWTPLLIAAMTVLMCEQSLAWWWGRKR